jgi:hypothetical protein
MRMSKYQPHRRARCSSHQWSTPMFVAGMRRWICERCGEITLELTDQTMSLPDSLRVPEDEAVPSGTH